MPYGDDPDRRGIKRALHLSHECHSPENLDYTPGLFTAERPVHEN